MTKHFSEDSNVYAEVAGRAFRNAPIETESEHEDIEWAYEHIKEVSVIQGQTIYGSFDEAGLLYEVDLDKHYLARSLNEYAKQL